ncbi:MAG: cupin domain-containing protein [Rhizobiaceae bacterium]
MHQTRRFEKPKKTNRTILPIILAAGSNLDQWPNSRINLPIQFQKSHGRPSLFEQTLASLSHLNHDFRPIIALPTASLEIARAQLDQTAHSLDPKIIIEPMDRGTMTSVLASAFLAAKIDRSAMMVIIDASRPPTDWAAFERLIQQTLASPLANEKNIFCGQPNQSGSLSLNTVKKTIPTEDPLIHHYERLQNECADPTFDLGAVTFSTPSHLLEQVRLNKPCTFTSCNKALELASIKENELWPDLNIWAALPFDHLENVLPPDTKVLRPVDLQIANHRHHPSSKFVYQHDNTNCHIESDGHLITVTGCTGLHIVSTKDATLITQQNYTIGSSKVLEKLQRQERREIFEFPTKQQTWGKQVEVDRQSGYSVHRLEVELGQTIPPHLHNYRSENWQILKGKGSAVIDNIPRPMITGVSIDLPRNTLHTCKNTGDEPLIILESRFGPKISEADYVALELHKSLENV